MVSMPIRVCLIDCAVDCDKSQNDNINERKKRKKPKMKINSSDNEAKQTTIKAKKLQIHQRLQARIEIKRREKAFQSCKRISTRWLFWRREKKE